MIVSFKYRLKRKFTMSTEFKRVALRLEIDGSSPSYLLQFKLDVIFFRLELDLWLETRDKK
jgi:hypothetical protein